AIVEQGSLWSDIRINDKEVRPDGKSWWLDRAFSILDIGSGVRTGENTLTLKIDPMRIYAEIEPVYLLGNFNLHPAAKGWHITEAHPLTFGSWNKQGMPMYSA